MIRLIRRLVAAVLLAAAGCAAALAGLWGYTKAAGAEVDISIGDDYTSGWWVVAGFAVAAIVLALAGIAVWRRRDGMVES